MNRTLVAVVVLVAGFAAAGLARGDQPTTRPNDLERGRELYERHCVQCHGALNDGQGPAAKALVKPVPNLQEAITAGNFEDMVAVVLDGKGTMPSFVNSFDKYDARRALRHMKGLGHADAEEVPDEEEPETPDEDAPDAPADGPGE